MQKKKKKSLLQHHSSKASILRRSAFFIVQLSHPYMTTGKTIALTRRTFVGKVVSLLLNMLFRLVITFLPKSKCLLISWLQSPSAVILPLLYCKTYIHKCNYMGFSSDSVVKNSPGNAGDAGSIPGLARFPGEGNGNPLQYSCLEKPMDRGAWQATVHGITKSWTQLSDWTTTIYILTIEYNSNIYYKYLYMYFNYKYFILCLNIFFLSKLRTVGVT